MLLPTVASLALALSLQAAAPQDEPAKLVQDGLPEQPRLTVGGGEVLLELAVTSQGAVERIDRLRVTAPYGDLVASAVERWRFQPASIVKDGRRESTDSKVLVVALFRPPAMYMGGTLGEPVRDLARPSGEAPSVGELIAPPYPPNARADALILVEVEIAANGDVGGTRVLRSGGVFDEAAVAAIKQWSFSPARLATTPTSYAYVIVGFREPVVGASPR
jgi:TonB family protein